METDYGSAADSLYFYATVRLPKLLVALASSRHLYLPPTFGRRSHGLLCSVARSGAPARGALVGTADRDKFGQLAVWAESSGRGAKRAGISTRSVHGGIRNSGFALGNGAG